MVSLGCILIVCFLVEAGGEWAACVGVCGDICMSSTGADAQAADNTLGSADVNMA
jgi:hypothetical protein